MAIFIQFHDHKAPGWEKTEQSPGSVTEEILDGHEKGHDQRHNLQENGPCHGQRPDTGCIVAKPGAAAWHWMKRSNLSTSDKHILFKSRFIRFLWFLETLGSFGFRFLASVKSPILIIQQPKIVRQLGQIAQLILEPAPNMEWKLQTQQHQQPKHSRLLRSGCFRAGTLYSQKLYFWEASRSAP